MGKAISVTIGKHHFRKKGDLTEYMRSMVGKYRVGEFLNADDTKFCLTLFESHSDFPQKLVPGVERIQVLEQEKGTVGFQIHKTDGESDNISWTDCVNNRK
jgi:hypothetical protein